MTAAQHEKWRALARRYPSLSEYDQHKLQRRMLRWASADPQKRESVRKKYQSFKQRKPEDQEHVRTKWKKQREVIEQAKVADLSSVELMIPTQEKPKEEAESATPPVEPDMSASPEGEQMVEQK